MTKINIYPTSDMSLIVQGLGEKKLSFQKLLQQELVIEVIDFISAYQNLLIIYNLNVTSYKQLAKKIQYLWKIRQKNLPILKGKFPKKKIVIPTYYDPVVGWDLEEISAKKKISISKIIELHISTSYEVLAIGFLVGFAYLGGLYKKLYLPRKKNARIFVPQGSVAIANDHSAIYPQKSAGGWNVIGKTYLSLIDWKKKNPCLLQMGDIVKFESISKEEFLKNGGELIQE